MSRADLVPGFYWFKWEDQEQPWTIVEIRKYEYGDDSWVAFPGSDQEDLLQHLVGKFIPVVKPDEIAND